MRKRFGSYSRWELRRDGQWKEIYFKRTNGKYGKRLRAKISQHTRLGLAAKRLREGSTGSGNPNIMEASAVGRLSQAKKADEFAYSIWSKLKKAGLHGAVEVDQRDWLNANYITTRHGKAWTRTQVVRMITRVGWMMERDDLDAKAELEGAAVVDTWINGLPRKRTKSEPFVSDPGRTVWLPFEISKTEE